MGRKLRVATQLAATIHGLSKAVRGLPLRLITGRSGSGTAACTAGLAPPPGSLKAWSATVSLKRLCCIISCFDMLDKQNDFHTSLISLIYLIMYPSVSYSESFVLPGKCLFVL